MCDNPCEDFESLPLPKNWHAFARHAVLNVIGIVRIAMLAGRETLMKNGDMKEARIHQLESEVAMLREELRINGTRLQRIAPHRRPLKSKRRSEAPTSFRIFFESDQQFWETGKCGCIQDIGISENKRPKFREAGKR